MASRSPRTIPRAGESCWRRGMRCDLLLDAVGQPGQRFAVGDVFSPRAAYDLLQLVYEAEPLRPRPLAGSRALPPNPLSEPDLAGAQEHEMSVVRVATCRNASPRSTNTSPKPMATGLIMAKCSQ